MADSREDRIRARAHAIWLKEGQPSGHEARHWQQAIDEVDAEDAAKPAPAKKKAAAPAKKAAAPKTAAKPKAAAAPKAASTAAKKPAKKG